MDIETESFAFQMFMTHSCMHDKKMSSFFVTFAWEQGLWTMDIILQPHWILHNCSWITCIATAVKVLVSGKCTAYKYPWWWVILTPWNSLFIKNIILSTLWWYVNKKMIEIYQSVTAWSVYVRYSWSEPHCNCCHIFCFRKVHYILLLRMVIWTGWNSLLMKELISTLKMKMG